MSKESFSAPSDTNAQEKKTASKIESRKRPPQTSKWAAVLAAGMAVVAEASHANAQSQPESGYDTPYDQPGRMPSSDPLIRAAQNYDQPGSSAEIHTDAPTSDELMRRAENYDAPPVEVSFEELNSRWTAALETIRDPSLMRSSDRSATTVYDGSVELSHSSMATAPLSALRPAQENIRLPRAQSLRTLEGHRIAISTVNGMAEREMHGPGVGRSDNVRTFHFRVLDLSADAHLQRTGRHVVQAEEADTEDQALALAFSHLQLHSTGPRETITRLQAHDGGRAGTLHVETHILNNVAINVHIRSMERMRNGHFRVTIEADEAREVMPNAPGR